jgi:hypothetical protein
LKTAAAVFVVDEEVVVEGVVLFEFDVFDVDGVVPEV